MARDLDKERNVPHDHDPDGGRIGHRMAFPWVLMPASCTDESCSGRGAATHSCDGP